MMRTGLRSAQTVGQRSWREEAELGPASHQSVAGFGVKCSVYASDAGQ